MKRIIDRLPSKTKIAGGAANSLIVIITILGLVVFVVALSQDRNQEGTEIHKIQEVKASGEKNQLETEFYGVYTGVCAAIILITELVVRPDGQPRRRVAIVTALGTLMSGYLLMAAASAKHPLDPYIIQGIGGNVIATAMLIGVPAALFAIALIDKGGKSKQANLQDGGSATKKYPPQRPTAVYRKTWKKEDE